MERSQDKMRPSLPRSKDLPAAGTDEQRCRNHDAGGRFTADNDAARGRGWKQALNRIMGRGTEITDSDAVAIAEDAWRIFCASIRELPNEGANVRGLVATKAFHEALASYWGSRVFAFGPATPEGLAASEQATKHGMRAERLTVTAVDVARSLGRRKDNKPPAWIVAVEEGGKDGG